MRAWVGTQDQGGLIAADQPAISVLDHGFTVADGVFETLKVLDGVPFALTRHLNRLRRSTQAMALPAPDDEWVRGAIHAVLGGNPTAGLHRLRVTYTAGIGPLGSDRGHAAPTLAVALSSAVPWPPTTTVATVPWVRNERSALSGVKSTSYAENVLALRLAHQQGASEALFADTRGRLSEGTGSNVFVVLGGELLTPTLGSGCLAGITRELVLEWARATEQDLPMDVLQEAEEVFLTSSTRDVHPVSRIDQRDLGAPGPVTAEVSATFRERAARNSDP